MPWRKKTDGKHLHRHLPQRRAVLGKLTKKISYGFFSFLGNKKLRKPDSETCGRFQCRRKVPSRVVVDRQEEKEEEEEGIEEGGIGRVVKYNILTGNSLHLPIDPGPDRSETFLCYMSWDYLISRSVPITMFFMMIQLLHNISIHL